jgi:hypothetical protein
MKKMILLLSFILLWVFPPKAWNQVPNYGSGGASAEFMRQMERQTNDQKNQIDQQQQQPQNKTEGLNQKQFSKELGKKDQEAPPKKKTGSEDDKNHIKN